MTFAPLVNAPEKIPGSLKMVFVGRIHPIKNLDFLLRVLQTTEGQIELTVIATLEDAAYWQKCQALMEQLKERVKVRLLENIPHEKIEGIILSNHIFVLPTKGENFGHAIFEALAAGRPVLISDQTLWRNLETKKAGWDLSLEDEASFSRVINGLVGMDEAMIKEWCLGAWELAHHYVEKSDTRKSMLHIFNKQA